MIIDSTECLCQAYYINTLFYTRSIIIYYLFDLYSNTITYQYTLYISWSSSEISNINIINTFYTYNDQKQDHLILSSSTWALINFRKIVSIIRIRSRKTLVGRKLLLVLHPLLVVVMAGFSRLSIFQRAHVLRHLDRERGKRVTRSGRIVRIQSSSHRIN